MNKFQPLNNYFLIYENYKIFFSALNYNCILCTHYAQSASFPQVLLKIEGLNIFTIEDANKINSNFPHATRNIMMKVQDTGSVNDENVKDAPADFYKTSKEYLNM